ncbi:amidohydrolase family protein [Eisenibacter elegans]|uniref:amidohydrolase family protein n=1 Tax=Eisenibacter elegans TaxID=997 RepID=UPI0004079BFA|nr:amidohydrolase family protein [Eisenibacter elegans]
MKTQPSTSSRRRVLKQLALAGTGLAIAPTALVSLRPRTDSLKIAINNGKVFSQGSIRPLHLGITQDNRLRLSTELLNAPTVIDASGKIVSPGFVDILADNASNPKNTYRIFEKYKISDGCTTVLQMHGGDEYPAAFHQYFDRQPHYVNYGIGVFVMRLKYIYSNPKDVYRYVEKGLEEGALGVCHSIEYQPTPFEELLEYAKLVQKYDRPLFLHLRHSSKEKELEGVSEAIALAQQTGARVHIDHLHSTGGTYNMPAALEMIDNANNMGMEITTCVYPYSYWATYIASKRFDAGWQQRFGLTYEDLTVVGTGAKITAQNFDFYRKQMGVLVAVPEGTVPFDKTVNLALQTDFCMIGSDGGIESEPRANNHPRGAGCFATALRHAQNIGMSLDKMLTKMTSLPAKLMRPSLNERAVIKDKAIADITIFDPKTIQGKATVTNPNQFSEGIECVIVNGHIAYRDKKILLSKGVPIRY